MSDTFKGYVNFDGLNSYSWADRAFNDCVIKEEHTLTGRLIRLGKKSKKHLAIDRAQAKELARLLNHYAEHGKLPRATIER